MGKLVVSLDGVVIKEVPITKDKTTLGRRPYNDVVIDNLAVSGEHAVLQMAGSEVFIEDLNSTNGTYINGKAVRRQQLRNGDVVEVGKYRLRYQTSELTDYEKTVTLRGGGTVPGALGPVTGSGGVGGSTGHGTLSGGTVATLKVLTGAAAGRSVQLSKVVTTLGKPGVQVASITKRPGGYVLAHVEGAVRPLVNGAAVQQEPTHLHSGDLIELAGTQMQFVTED